MDICESQLTDIQSSIADLKMLAAGKAAGKGNSDLVCLHVSIPETSTSRICGRFVGVLVGVRWSYPGDNHEPGGNYGCPLAQQYFQGRPWEGLGGNFF